MIATKNLTATAHLNSLSWLGIVRLGLVQAALGAIVVLTTSTINRVMVVELMLPAIIPGALVALHHALQLLRPRMAMVQMSADAARRGSSAAWQYWRWGVCFQPWQPR